MNKNRVDEFIEHPRKALFILAIPTVISMLVQITYNIADTAYVGRLGAESIAALTFSFPLFFILIAINSGIGVGMGSRVSRLLGAKKKEQAENTAMHGLCISIVLAIIISLLGIVSLKRLFRLFGADENVLPLAINYMSIILIAIVFMFVSAIVNTIFSSQGDTKTPMKIQISSLLINIILDPIFIYILDFGVKGAAIATLIAFIISMVIGIFYLNRRSYLKISLSSFNFSLEIIKDILFIGIPATLMMLIISIYVMFINRFMSYFGTEYVAAFGIVARLENVAIMPMLALSFSIITLVGMFYGAERYDLLKGIISYGIKIATLFTSFVGIIFFLVPHIFLRIFTADTNLLSLGSAYMRINVFTFPLMSVATIISRAMQGMGSGLPGLIINVFRVIIVAVPAAYIFVYVLNYSYLYIGAAAIMGGIASNITAFIWLRLKLNKIRDMSKSKVVSVIEN